MSSIAVDVGDLFRDHRQSLIHSIFSIVGCPQTAEDLAQEAYLKLLQTAQSQDIHFPRPFLYQIGRNLALDHLRKQQVRQAGVERDRDDDGEDDLLARLPAGAPTPDRQVEDQQQVALLMKALEGLSERRRQILVMHKFHHWPYERIARHFGISRSAVEKNVQVALAHLLAAQMNGTD
ncbi:MULTISPECIES: RNA polymerase sigma factor [Methylomonas]|uniref:RNA polymerase subunit sigma-24 n=1 Tax=Methylomonas koyamae TaxID=702114 RepID=A0A177NGQ4_9GAMM|nr:RNA polymerase sigma factor [Methylomonas koyamae]NJA05049.1 RNA polymerase sigma factor [Methylococcaceae bacterium WWC4]OAI17228.1 hypothetical protein A1355_08660 [Methylomonas koyamae]